MDVKKKMKVTPGRIRADVKPGTYKAESNTLDVVFATQTPVRRYDWWEDRYYNEVLEVSEEAIDFTRLKNGASVLDSHKAGSLDSVIGVVTGARIEGENAVATIRLSEEESDKEIINKIRNGIIRNISVGYDVLEYTETGTRDNTDLLTVTATRWQPMEISFVPVPADYNSQVRSKQENNNFKIVNIKNPAMDKTEEQNRNQPEAQNQAQPAAEPKAPAKDDGVNVEEIRKQAVTAERQRVSEIREACTQANLDAEFATTLIQSDVDINEARKQIIDEVAKRSHPAPTNQGAVTLGHDESDRTRDAVVEGIMERLRPGSVKDFGQKTRAREVRNMRLLELAKDRLRSHGVNPSLMKDVEIVKRAISTTDYPLLLSDAIQRTLRRDYTTVVQPWQMIARRESATDFRQKTGIKVDGKADFDIIPEGGEYKSAPILQDEEATIKLRRFGRIYPISYEAIVNDDLGVISRIPRLINVASQKFQSDKVWGLIINNSKAPDGKAIFHSDHKNYKATSGAAPSETTLSDARVALRRMKSPAGNLIGVSPKFLIVPPELETTAQKLVSAVIATATGDVNVFAGQLQVVVCDTLTDTQAWYLVADPNEITADGLVYAYMDGNEGVNISSYIDEKTDALNIKANMSFDAAVWGYQGWYKNVGH